MMQNKAIIIHISLFLLSCLICWETIHQKYQFSTEDKYFNDDARQFVPPFYDKAEELDFIKTDVEKYYYDALIPNQPV